LSRFPYENFILQLAWIPDLLAQHGPSKDTVTKKKVIRTFARSACNLASHAENVDFLLQFKPTLNKYSTVI